MGWKFECKECGNTDSNEIEYVGNDQYLCKKCNGKRVKEIYVATPYERTRAYVYATGNKWAIENFNATH